MRAREFVKEEKQGKLHQTHLDSLPPSKKFPQMDNSYEMYRFGISMATSPGITTDPVHGPVGDAPMVVSYSDGDEEIINSTLKQHGVKHSHLTAHKSGETDGTHKVSPVAARKKNKYGV